MTVNAYGTVFMKPYVVTVRHGEEYYEFFIPPYEAEKISVIASLPLPIA